ncbi:MAG: hypothetical protein SFU25_02090 [Candidatus Caenarcaniphilales bacterium]|nr:hypothetical protein [Candidatus Caenarcaniphilales bacterium]
MKISSSQIKQFTLNVTTPLFISTLVHSPLPGNALTPQIKLLISAGSALVCLTDKSGLQKNKTFGFLFKPIKDLFKDIDLQMQASSATKELIRAQKIHQDCLAEINLLIAKKQEIISGLKVFNLPGTGFLRLKCKEIAPTMSDLTSKNLDRLDELLIQAQTKLFNASQNKQFAQSRLEEVQERYQKRRMICPKERASSTRFNPNKHNQKIPSFA